MSQTTPKSKTCGQPPTTRGVGKSNVGYIAYCNSDNPAPFLQDVVPANEHFIARMVDPHRGGDSFIGKGTFGVLYTQEATQRWLDAQEASDVAPVSAPISAPESDEELVEIVVYSDGSWVFPDDRQFVTDGACDDWVIRRCPASYFDGDWEKVNHFAHTSAGFPPYADDPAPEASAPEASASDAPALTGNQAEDVVQPVPSDDEVRNTIQAWERMQNPSYVFAGKNTQGLIDLYRSMGLSDINTMRAITLYEEAFYRRNEQAEKVRYHIDVLNLLTEQVQTAGNIALEFIKKQTNRGG